nr:MAG TPA: hypothetical protein [Caudoviricetes sp.]DAM90037.1 MAG TPA: hypothetical protein [Caudoviricetes sp.]
MRAQCVCALFNVARIGARAINKAPLFFNFSRVFRAVCQ